MSFPVVFGIMIDPPVHHETDDAFLVRRSGENWLVTISFPNTIDLVRKDSRVDLDALFRGKSVYREHTTQTMLPEFLWRKASVGPGKINRAVTVTLTFNRDLAIIDQRFELTSLRVIRKYTYDEADHYLKKPEKEADVPWRDIREFAEGIAFKRRQKRWEARREKFRDGQWRRVYPPQPSRVTSKVLIEELMILANTAIARHLANNKVPSLFRNQKHESAPRRYSTKPRGHCDYRQKYYGYWTAPLRSYAALVNNRQLVSHIKGQAYPHSYEDISRIARVLNLRSEQEKRKHRDESTSLATAV